MPPFGWIQVVALVDQDGDGRAESKVDLITVGLEKPTGVAWRNGSLYVSGFAGGRGVVWRYDGVDAAALAGGWRRTRARRGAGGPSSSRAPTQRQEPHPTQHRAARSTPPMHTPGC